MTARRIRRWLWITAALLAGMAVGTVGVIAVERPTSGDGPASTAGDASLTPTGLPEARLQPAPVSTGGSPTLLIWTPDRLPPSLAAEVGRLPGVDRLTSVGGGLLPLYGSWDGSGQPVDRPPSGFHFGLDTMVFDPATYPAFLPPSARPAFDRLGPTQAILGASSAKLRRLGVGATLQLGDGRRYTVAAVVADDLVGATELAVSATSAEALPPVYLLVTYHGDRGQIEAAVRSLLPEKNVRFRAPGETPFLRQGDSVLAQVFIKQRFGEFAYRDGPGKQIVQDPQWERANLVVADVPILGRVRCNFALIAELRGAMAELQRRNLGFLISGFEGCWNPVLISPGGDLSRHAWGAAVDLNYGKNPTGAASGQDPRLVEVMERWGFTWGGAWLVPDPSHFEYLRPPTG